MSNLSQSKPAILAKRAIKDALALALLRTRFIRAVKVPEGHKVQIPPHLRFQDYLNLRRGLYEAEEIGLLRAQFKNAGTIVEIGGNIGVVSRVLAHEKLNPEGRLICIEPNPIAVPTLERNLSGIAGKTTDVVNIAICPPDSDQKEMPFYSRSNLSSGLAEHVRRKPLEKVKVVPVRSLSNVVQEIDGRYSLVCDAEGAEIDIILKDGAALERCDQIMIEFHPPKLTGREETPEHLLDVLEDYGFSTQEHRGSCYYLSRAVA